MLGINRNQAKLSPLQSTNAWANFTVKIWKEKLAKLRIGNSMQLESSFDNNVLSAVNGDIIKIEFEFRYYGKFVDMGVGRGQKIGDVKESITSRRLDGRMLGNRRRAKKWYSKTLFAETAKLGEIMARDYAHQGVINVVENIGDNSTRK